MKPTSGHLMEILEKLTQAEDQLRSQKLNLFKTEDLFNEEVEDWAKEIKAEKLKAHANEKGIKLKESEIEEMTKEINELSKESNRLVSEHKDVEAELEVVKGMQETEVKNCKEEEGALMGVLTKVEEEQKNLMKLNRWTKFFLDKESSGQEAETDSQLNDETKKIISEQIGKKLEVLDKDLIEVARAEIKFKQQRLKEMKETLFNLKTEVKVMEKKSHNLEKQIQLLEKEK